MTLSDRIRARLLQTGKSASAAALEAGLSRSAVLDILSGKAGSPRVDTIISLAKVLHCTPEYLVTGGEKVGESRMQTTLDLSQPNRLLDASIYVLYVEDGSNVGIMSMDTDQGMIQISINAGFAAELIHQLTEFLVAKEADEIPQPPAND